MRPGRSTSKIGSVLGENRVTPKPNVTEAVTGDKLVTLARAMLARLLVRRLHGRERKVPTVDRKYRPARDARQLPSLAAGGH
jgi:hypothetical protein